MWFPERFRIVPHPDQEVSAMVFCRKSCLKWCLTEVVSCPCFQLAPDDAWRCPHCKQLQQGSITLSLWTLPDVLIIHLKRFRQVGKSSVLVRKAVAMFLTPLLVGCMGILRVSLFDLVFLSMLLQTHTHLPQWLGSCFVLTQSKI